MVIVQDIVAQRTKVTLTKAELIQKLVETVGLNRREAAEMIDAFFAEIGSALASGEDVKLSGFGGFHLREKGERPGRNPRTGQKAIVAARRVVTFHPSQKLKLAVSPSASGHLNSTSSAEREHPSAARRPAEVAEPVLTRRGLGGQLVQREPFAAIHREPDGGNA